jgi:hypothetical protein
MQRLEYEDIELQAIAEMRAGVWLWTMI